MAGCGTPGRGGTPDCTGRRAQHPSQPRSPSRRPVVRLPGRGSLRCRTCSSTALGSRRCCPTSVGSDLCRAIGLTDGVETLQQLRIRGLLVSAGEADGYELNPLVKNFANDRLAVDAQELTELSLRAGQWFESVGEHRDALACYQAFDPPAAARMLHERGHAMVSGGSAEIVVAAVAELPPELRDAAMDQLEGEARQVLGDWQGAVDCFDRIIEPEGEIPVAIAWRLGLIHHLRGHTDVAIATYRRGRIDGEQPTDEALLQAWWAGAHW